MRLSKACLTIFDPGAAVPPPAGGPAQNQPVAPQVNYNFNAPPQAPIPVGKTQEQLAAEMHAAEVARLNAAQRPIAEPEKVTNAERIAALEHNQRRLEADNLRLRLIASARSVGKQFYDELVQGNTPNEINASIEYSCTVLAKHTGDALAKAQATHRPQVDQNNLSRQAAQGSQPPTGYTHGNVPPPGQSGYPQWQPPSNVPQFAAPAQAFNGPPQPASGFPTPEQIMRMPPHEYERWRPYLNQIMRQGNPNPNTTLNPYTPIAPPPGQPQYGPPPTAYQPAHIPPNYQNGPGQAYQQAPPQGAPWAGAAPPFGQSPPPSPQPTAGDQQFAHNLQQSGVNLGNDPAVAAWQAAQAIMAQRQQG